MLKTTILTLALLGAATLSPAQASTAHHLDGPVLSSSSHVPSLETALKKKHKKTKKHAKHKALKAHA